MQHRKSSPNCVNRYKCKECGKEFKIPSLLDEHKQIHKPEDEQIGFMCEFDGCKKFYTMKKNLDAHFRRKHGDLKDAFKCTHEGCGRTLSTKKKLEDHIKIMHSIDRITDKKAGPRNQRRDAGKPRILEQLTGLSIPRKIQEEVLAGELECVVDTDNY